MVYSYSNFPRTAELKLSTYPRGSDLFTRSVNQSGVISRTEVQMGSHGLE
jgi:hypothetical protein